MPLPTGAGTDSSCCPQVQHLVSRCTCPVQFPMIKVSEGKYRVGDSDTLIFVRVSLLHLMHPRHRHQESYFAPIKPLPYIHLPNGANVGFSSITQRRMGSVGGSHEAILTLTGVTKQAVGQQWDLRPPRLSGVGRSRADVAWLWVQILREHVRIAVSTFSCIRLESCFHFTVRLHVWTCYLSFCKSQVGMKQKVKDW